MTTKAKKTLSVYNFHTQEVMAQYEAPKGKGTLKLSLSAAKWQLLHLPGHEAELQALLVRAKGKGIVSPTAKARAKRESTLPHDEAGLLAMIKELEEKGLKLKAQ